ncbi:hypothetical protein Tco_1091956 [Tanacetum coccineum]|uniref:Uncharacterized protein n=1 Tax=Tanacetum coccineum TaxID=301880 RepID=A0ABQ5I8J2_9ASTR
MRRWGDVCEWKPELEHEERQNNRPLGGDMDWLSKRKFVIVCHEKVVRIPLESNEILQVHGERTQGVVKTLNKHKDLVHGATLVAKSPYRLAPLEMQELSEQLREFARQGEELGSTYDTIRDMIILRIASYHLSIRCASFEALYGRKCRSHVLWVEIIESSLSGLELVQETTDKVVLIKKKLKAVRDRPKELCWIGLVADSLHVPLDEIKVDQTLRFVEEPVENSDCEVKSYAAMPTLLWAGKVVSSKISCEN